MNMRNLKVLAVAAVLVLGAGVASAESALWLHVRVDSDHGENVTINLPLSLVEKAIPMIPDEHFEDGEFVLGHGWNGDHHITISELRDLWNELKSSPDMTFVTVEDRDETVKVSKSGGYLRVLKAGFRNGDNAPMAIIEFVDRDADAKGAADRARTEAAEAEEA